MKQFSAVALLALIVSSVAVMWVDARWVTTLPEVAAFALAAVWIIAFASGRYRPEFSAGMIPLTAAVLWIVIQLVTGHTVYRWRTVVGLLYWAANLAVYFVALQAFSDRKLRFWFLRALLLFGFLISIISPLQALTTQAKVFWLFQIPNATSVFFGPFVYTNQYAAFIELLLPIALYFALTEEKGQAFYVLVAAVMYTSVIAASSRMGFTLTTLEILIVPLLAVRFRQAQPRQILIGGALFAGMIILLAVAVGPDNLLARFSQSDPYVVRREFVYSSFNMIKASPFFGVGLGNWSTAYPAWAQFDSGRFANQAHNDWIQWAVEGGLPFAALMLLLAIRGIPQGVRSVWGVGVAALFLHCLVDYPIQRTAVAVVFFTLLAATAAENTRCDSEPADNRLSTL